MAHKHYRVSIESLENGFKVEVPDMEMIAKKMAAAKKEKQPDPYIGDAQKSFAAKSVKEVLALVKRSLEKLPENEFDTAFSEAAATR